MHCVAGIAILGDAGGPFVGLHLVPPALSCRFCAPALLGTGRQFHYRHLRWKRTRRGRFLLARLPSTSLRRRRSFELALENCLSNDLVHSGGLHEMNGVASIEE